MADLSAFKTALIKIANREYENFNEITETNEPLRSRIDEYCTGIGIDPPEDIGEFPWSATFISWCVKMAGADESEFKFSETHAVFVKAAIANAASGSGKFRGRRVEDYSPKVGDLIHFNRNNGRITYSQAARRNNYPSHSAIVVSVDMAAGRRFAMTIGGNEGDSVRRTKVPLTSSGLVQQRESNPYICVVETLKIEAAAQLEAAFVGAAEAETFACAGSGRDEEVSLESAFAQGMQVAVSKPTVDRTIWSPNKSSRNGQDISHIVVHYTTSRSIEGTISHFKNRSSEVSAHYIIGQDGELVQMVRDSDSAWHAGGTTGMNRRSIGIEHVARAGDKITHDQEVTSIALIRWLMQEYDVSRDNVIPHVCVKPTDCCGDLFKDYGGARGLNCGPQHAAVKAWLEANGIGTHGSVAALELAMAAPDNDETAFATAAMTPRLTMAKSIVDFEARRDGNGNIKVYYLPPGDGGGRYEVAGINERFHKQVCDELVELIESGRPAEAERRAIEYIATYTDPVSRWTSSAGIECYLRDCMFNRGMGGAAWIVQKAVGVDTDRRVGTVTRAAIAAAETQPRGLLDKLRSARERYEREVVGRSEGSPFWNGLVNRWNKAKSVALGFVSP